MLRKTEKRAKILGEYSKLQVKSDQQEKKS